MTTTPLPESDDPAVIVGTHLLMVFDPDSDTPTAQEINDVIALVSPGNDGDDGDPGTPGGVGPVGPIGPGAAGIPTTLSRFVATTTVNAAAQSMSTVYADILEIDPTDVLENIGGFTYATVGNITTITIPNSGLYEITCTIKVDTAGTIRSQLYLRANILRSGVIGSWYWCYYRWWILSCNSWCKGDSNIRK